MKIERALNEYQQYVEGIEGVRHSSALTYRSKVNMLLKKFSKDGVTLPVICEDELAGYFSEMRGVRGINTRRVAVTAIKAFYRWLTKKHGFENPTLNVKPIREYVRMKDVLSLDQVEKMIVSCGRDNFLQVRNAAIICVLADTGIRVSELTALRLGDVTMEEKQFVMSVPATKGNRGRSVPFAYQAEGGLVAECFGYYYLQVKYKLGWSPSDPLFQRTDVLYRKVDGGWVEGKCPNWDPGPLSRYRVGQLVSRIAKSAKIDKKVSPHDFRHFYATYLAAKGMDPVKIQGRLGHANLDRIMRYIHLAELIKGDAAKDNPLSNAKAGWAGAVKTLAMARSMENKTK